MTNTVKLIQNIAGDDRISDKYFRWIFMELSRISLSRMMVKDRLAILREQAIIETERESQPVKIG